MPHFLLRLVILSLLVAGGFFGFSYYSKIEAVPVAEDVVSEDQAIDLSQSDGSDAHSEQESNLIKTLVLNGTKHQMGVQYGKALHTEMRAALGILKEFFIAQHNITEEQLIDKANLFYNRYPEDYKDLIHGVAEGSELSLDDVKILNGMETLSSLVNRKAEVAACAFVAVPAQLTSSDGTLIGRNYDFPKPFDEISKFLTVAVLNEPGTVPTAIIAMPGQIYCPTCINKNGIFIELNNGMPSGGYSVNMDQESLLINLLKVLQHSENMEQVHTQLSALNTDYSLVINAADRRSALSFEFSSSMGSKGFVPDKNETHVSTNFYLNKDWGLETPSDEQSWLAVTRRNNLLKLTADKNQLSPSDMMHILDQKIKDGGAEWEPTIYQIVYNTATHDLYLDRAVDNNNWQYVNLSSLFGISSAMSAADAAKEQ